MFFGYPVEATFENWLHDCLFEILQSIHINLKNNQGPPAWPEIIPELWREKLRGRKGLKNRLAEYQEAAAGLDETGLNQITNALSEQNKIALLLSGTCNCSTIDDFPESIRQPVRNLFEYAFGLLTDLGIRDCQYRLIYYSTPYHVCPFCGCEYFDAPGARREELDHYLLESKYPFAAVNLRNLVPMGHKCNSYKLAQDILHADDGSRRKSFYPYDNHAGIRVSLDQSVPFERSYQLFPFPLWQIDFEPETEEVSTWDTVFRIRERYRRDILDPDFLSWLREFSSWCRSANVRPVSEQDVVDALRRYSEHMDAMHMRDRAFLKAAVFRMLLRHCQQGNQRLITLMNGVVIGGMA